MVYLPAGIYRTGELGLHSNMEQYLEEGATLQGMDNPEDYLPRIWSRFDVGWYRKDLTLSEKQENSDLEK